MGNVKVADAYKDWLFRMIFNDKKKLLEFYNRMNGSEYKDASELQVAILEKAIYLSMKNDVAYGWFSEEKQGGGCKNVSLWIWRRKTARVRQGRGQDGTAWRISKEKIKKGYSKEAVVDSLEIDSDTVEAIISAITIAK